LVVDARLDSMGLTPASYQAALRELAAAITAGLPVQSEPTETTYGVDAYGLDREWLRRLIEQLLPLILQLLVRR
jgi:tRNA A37 threonylcarbamoyladenosine synthetase subunit TsaC/SUA5/YrdC